MELEEAKRILLFLKEQLDESVKLRAEYDDSGVEDETAKAIEIILQALEKQEKLKAHCKELIQEKQELTTAIENSIPKETIRDFIKNNAYNDTYNFKTIEVSKLEELLER